jgi:hypothetical protein
VRSAGRHSERGYGLVYRLIQTAEFAYLLGLGLYEAFVKTLIVANEILALALSESQGTSETSASEKLTPTAEIYSIPAGRKY